MTKMIYIPPFQMLPELRSGTAHRHLMLPHLIYKEEYSRFFVNAKKLGQYIILDNGKAEGEEISFNKLTGIAHTYNVDEIVLPDSMGDPEETEALARDYLSVNRHRLPIKTKIGYVLQGRNGTEVRTAFDLLRTMHRLYSMIDVLYLPRLIISPEWPTARVDAAAYIFSQERLPKPIHFLGASPHAIDEGKWIRDGLNGRVRSMDTSAPFVYALNDAYIDNGSKMRRDIDTYFTSLWPQSKRDIAKRNMEIMDDWIGSKTSTSEV